MKKDEDKRRKIVGTVRVITGILIFLFGFSLFLLPTVRTGEQKAQTRAYIRTFVRENRTSLKKQETGKKSKAGTGKKAGKDSRLSACRRYNRRIASDGQKDFKDPWSVTVSPISVAGFPGGRFGYIEIPAMDVTLPLYLGATTENMAKGAAVLGGTSLPVGGESTNCVIAGHRGYRGIPYFREIERLGIGDKVYVTNAWKSMIYTVRSVEIIHPDDSDRVKIRKGKDLVTLITCHPYRSHGKYRYLVFCEHTGDRQARQRKETSHGVKVAVPESSAEDIRTEDTMRRFCGLALIGMAGVSAALAFHNLRRTKGNAD